MNTETAAPIQAESLRRVTEKEFYAQLGPHHMDIDVHRTWSDSARFITVWRRKSNSDKPDRRSILGVVDGGADISAPDGIYRYWLI